jgi:hypothetical protein
MPEKGKKNLPVPDAVHRTVKIAAAERGVEMGELLAEAVDAYLTGKAEQRMVKSIQFIAKDGVVVVDSIAESVLRDFLVARTAEEPVFRAFLDTGVSLLRNVALRAAAQGSKDVSPLNIVPKVAEDAPHPGGSSRAHRTGKKSAESH